MPSFYYKIKVFAPSVQVYEVLKDVASFSDFMHSVKKIDILKKEGNIINIKWDVDFDGVPIEWTEEIVFNDELHNIKFKSLTGDYMRSGQWNIYQDPEGKKTCISLEMTYNWNVPNFDHFFGDVYNKKAEKATKGMLYALKKRIS
ncbi:MAG: SRPBCC family protein [Endomicrobiaceae bacterium]|nr:SRPBCC family protein [Endomicrobiaceae bacterium]